MGGLSFEAGSVGTNGHPDSSSYFRFVRPDLFFEESFVSEPSVKPLEVGDEEEKKKKGFGYFSRDSFLTIPLFHAISTNDDDDNDKDEDDEDDKDERVASESCNSVESWNIGDTGDGDGSGGGGGGGSSDGGY
ncbi:hypothetical protein M0802_005343 [Mischocyttarus mexicanus]|nr:hypothetical protein M0802_005343 [Mischocyttarus mexicanus]